MEYKTRPGVLLIEICGKYLLISGRDERKYCPYMTEINDIGAMIWKQLDKHKNVEDIVSLIKDEYEIDDNVDLNTEIHKYITLLESNAYLLKDSDDQVENLD